MSVVLITTKKGRIPKQSPEFYRNNFASKLAVAIRAECGSFKVNMFLRGILCLPVLFLPLIVAKVSGMSTDLFLDFTMSIICAYHLLLLVALYADTVFTLRAHDRVVRENQELMIVIEASRDDLWRQVDRERQGEVCNRLAA